jgi:competence/damage-inducible protein CinA-like protein
VTGAGFAHAHGAGVVAIGDELLAGAHPDLNSPYLAGQLAEAGRHVERVVVVGDDESDIAAAIADMAKRVPLVIASGGLGPTLDDVTRHAAARAAGVELVRSEEAWDQVRAWYTRADRPMPDSNARQALVPTGATVLANRCGTAPGFRMSIGAAVLFVLPGPPAELADMYEHGVAPWLERHPAGEEVFRARSFYLHDLSESVFADAVGAWMERDANPRLGVTVKGGVMSAKLLARGRDELQALSLLDGRGAEFTARFGEHIFSEHTPDLALALGQVLLAKGLSVTAAESCTGGLVVGALTRVPGISAVLRESVVTYADVAKTERLGVPAELLEAHGAVSAEVAGAMARGAAARAGARLAVAVTGVAGPGGGTPAKPVGLVWFGVCLDGEVQTVSRRWPTVGRERVRAWATAKALALLLEAARRA